MTDSLPPPVTQSPLPCGRPGVVVSGMGAVSPLGSGVGAFLGGLRAGRSGVVPLKFEREGMKSSVGAFVQGFDPAAWMSDADQRRLPRHVPMAVAAASEALACAGLASIGPYRVGSDVPIADALAPKVGLLLGTGGGGIDFTLEQIRRMHQRERASLWSVTNATHGNMAGELSIRLGLRGPSLCISTGCASSSDAIGLAMDLLRSDRVGAPEAMIVIGADAHIQWETLTGMEMLGVISTRDFRSDPACAHTACRPFDASRDGFVLGEGAWAVVLERESFWRQREGRPAIGEMLGYASTCDAYHRVRPDPELTETVRAIRDAIADANTLPEQLSAIQYHGTATSLNDVHESQAVLSALGKAAEKLPGSSIKGAIGHPQGACGIAALVAMLGALGDPDPFVPPTINLDEPDERCPLDYTPRVAGKIDAVLAARPFIVNCLAFGAKNSVLVARAFRPQG